VPERPRFHQVNLVVSSTAASLDFYRRLGLDLPEETDLHLELLQEGPVTFELDAHESARIWNASWRRPEGGPSAVLGFEVVEREEVDRLYADLTGEGHPGVQPPFDAFWGARYAIVSDPDGNQIGLMSARDESRRHWPPNEAPDP
jgi:catechol 2,3-dioxygenase-like lactoylglutathione lyase family enzyme